MADPTLEDGSGLRRVARFAAVMVWVCRGLAVLVPLLVSIAWIALPEPAGADATMIALDAVDRAGGLLISLLPVGCVVFGLIALARVFAGLAAARGLDEGTAWPWITRDLGLGNRQFSIGIGSQDIAVLVIGALLLSLAVLLREAARIAEEHRQII